MGATHSYYPGSVQLVWGVRRGGGAVSGSPPTGPGPKEEEATVHKGARHGVLADPQVPRVAVPQQVTDLGAGDGRRGGVPPRVLEVVPRVPGMVHRVLGVVHRVLGVIHWVLGVVHQVLGVVHRVLGVAHQVLRVVHRVLGVVRGAAGT